MASKDLRLADTLRLLASHDVEFIVVGMAAGILAGVPVTTLDLDIVHRRSDENVCRLLGALREIEATYRNDPRRLAPNESHLIGPGHQLLATAFGDLDCLGTIDGGKTYEDLLPSTREVRLDDARVIRVLDLATLIEVKQRSGRPKDLAVIHLLEATLDEIRRRG